MTLLEVMADLHAIEPIQVRLDVANRIARA
jgi:hypothetical protein